LDQVGVPALGELAPGHEIDLPRQFRILFAVPGEEVVPGLAQLPAAQADAGRKMGPHLVGNQELLIRRPAVGRLGQPHFVFAQRGAVGRMGVLLVRGAVADQRRDDDQRGPVVGLLERGQGPAELVQIVHVVDLDDVPAVAGKPRGHVLAERQRRGTLDGDLVVVVDPAQVGELEVPGQRGRLAADPLHQIAVAAQGVDVEWEQLEIGPIVAGRQPAGGNGHAHAVGHALAQRARGRLHPGGMTVLRVSGATAIELAELPDVVERDGRLVQRLAADPQALHAA